MYYSSVNNPIKYTSQVCGLLHSVIYVYCALKIDVHCFLNGTNTYDTYLTYYLVTCYRTIIMVYYYVSTISQLYYGNQFNWWRTHGYQEKTKPTHPQTLSNFSWSRTHSLTGDDKIVHETITRI